MPVCTKETCAVGSGFQCCAQNLVVRLRSSDALQGCPTKAPVGLLSVGGVGCPQPRLCTTAKAINPRRRDHTTPVIEVTLFLKSKVIFAWVPGRTLGRQLQFGDVFILILSRSGEGILKVAYNTLKS